jgi:membrane-bound serine protease (ClpP class)
VVGLAGLVGASPAGAAARRGIVVVQVQGLLDPPNASLVAGAIRDANAARRTMVVLQINSGGAVDTDVSGLVAAVRRSRIPVVAWAGPSGGSVVGAAAVLFEAADRAYVAQGASIGPASPERLDRPGEPPTAQVAARLGALAGANGREADGAARLATRSMDPGEATRLGAADGVRPTLGEVVVSVDGETVRTAAGDVTLHTARVVGSGDQRRRQPNQDVIFVGMRLGAQLQHGLTSPSLAYFLLIAGLALIVFEFFAISIGLVGLVGAISVVAGCYGFSHLPVQWWAVALVVASIVALSVDVQSGGLGFWSVVGTITLVVGSIFLYGGSSRLDVPWWVMLLVIAGTLLFFAWGLTAAVRARFSTPTVGREGMVGRMGVAEVPIDPDGVALIDGARWRARTNRATPIAAGDAVRVVEVDGLVLEVEPEEGGAQDHRERHQERKRLREEARHQAEAAPEGAGEPGGAGPGPAAGEGPDAPA